MGEGVVQFIRLMLDRGSVDQATSDAAAAGARMGDAMGSNMGAAGQRAATNYGDGFRGKILAAFDAVRDTVNGALEKMGLVSRDAGEKAGNNYSSGFMSGIKGLAASLGVALGLRAIVDFGKGSVEAFSAFQAELNQTSQTLQNFGYRFEDVRSRLQDLQQEMLKTAGVGPTEFYTAFNRVLLLTGNLNTALKATPFVLNLASAANLDVERSATLLGKAIEGNTTTFQRYGINIDKTRPVLDQLDQLNNQAMARMSGFAGVIARTGGAWEMLKITLGQLITSTSSTTTVTDELSTGIQHATEWIKENASALKALGSLAADIFSGMMTTVKILGMAWIGLNQVQKAFGIGVDELKGIFQQLGGAVAVTMGGILEYIGKLVPAVEAAGKKLEDLGKSWGRLGDATRAAAEERNKHLNDPDQPLGDIPVRASGTPGKATVTPKQEGNADEALTKRIELLGKGLTIQETALASAQALDKIEEQENDKLKNKNLTLDQRVEIENHIDEITKARAMPDAKLNQEISTLEDRLKLNEDDADARTKLVAIQTELLAREKDTTASALDHYNVAKMLLSVNQALTKDAIQPLQEQAALVQQMSQYSETRNQALADGQALLTKVNGLLAASNISITDEIALLKIRNDLMKLAADDVGTRKLEQEATALEKLAASYKATGDDMDRLKTIQAALDKVIDTSADPTVVAQAKVARDNIQKTLDKYPLSPVGMFASLKRMFSTDLPAIAQGAAANMADSFTNAFGMMIDNAGKVRSALGNIATGMAAGFKKELADLAKQKVKENLAHSVEEAAKAIAAAAEQNYAGAALHGKAALEFLGVAAEWGALGGAAGGGGGGNTGGATSGGNTGGSTASTTTPNAPQIILTVDGIDPKNTRHQELAGLTVQQYAQRAGATFVVGSK